MPGLIYPGISLHLGFIKSLNCLEEQYLKKGLITRNRIVFDFVFHYYYSGLCAYCERFTCSKEAAEDIVQDLFETLWTNHQQINIKSSLKSYLFTAVKNRALDYIQRENRKKRTSAWDCPPEKPAENLSSFWFTESELQQILDKCLGKLPPRCREIFELNRFKGLKNKEIAAKLNLSKRTVELQISKALKQLRSELKDNLTAGL